MWKTRDTSSFSGSRQSLDASTKLGYFHGFWISQRKRCVIHSPWRRSLYEKMLGKWLTGAKRTHRIHVCYKYIYIYMVTCIPSIYPLYVSIYTSTMDPSWGREWMGLGVAWMGWLWKWWLGSFPNIPCELSTSKIRRFPKLKWGEVLGCFPKNHLWWGPSVVHIAMTFRRC